jgi:hypothetical protein
MTMPDRMRRLVTLCVVAVLAPSTLSAQLRGVILDAPTRAGLGGAVVTLLDPAGATTARALSDAAGRFSIARDPRSTKLRVMRIGYRPYEAALPATGAPLELVMERIPPMLSTVRVSDRELCPGSEDRGSAFLLWDQARAGLLATVVARELKPAMAKSVVYDSHMRPNDEVIRAQTKHIAQGRTSRPFVAAHTPSYFASHGYILDDPTTRIYNAPDADVLLDESFATTHCFHVQAADAAHRGQIGLAFSPAPGRDTLVEVTGVIWIDAAVPQLRSLDFLYTALEQPAMSAKAGGYIQFRTMPNGVAFVERWHLRLPSLQVAPMTTAASRVPRDPFQRVTRQERTDVRVHEIVEAGGMVIEATWDDGTLFRDSLAIIAGTVTQRQTKAPVANAIVTLVGTQDTVLTSPAGRFELIAIPGKYELSVSDTSLHHYVQSRLVSQLVEATRAHATRADLELAPIKDVLGNVCRDISVYDREVVLLGHVFAPDRARLPNAVVTTTWRTEYLAGGAIATREVRRDSDVDSDGRFVVCSVPLNRAVRMRLSMGKEALADTTMLLERNDLTWTVDWRIAPFGGKPPQR